MRQNDMSAKYFAKPNLQDRVKNILPVIEKQTDFQTERLLQKSQWWTSPSVGAIHYLGIYQDRPAVLKIQGVKPDISEVKNIEAFNKQNHSQQVRAPKIYASIPWNDQLQFEALIIEQLPTKKVVGTPAVQQEITEFFKVYQEYRQNCLEKPWLTKPTESLSEKITANFAQWGTIAQELHPDHPLRKPGDADLIQKAIKILRTGYQSVDWEFQHGHFSGRDVYAVDKQYVLTSNLYWGWRAPYYDLVFGFHWYQFDLVATQPNIETLQEHRNWWKTVIDEQPTDKKLLNLAYLERAAAGLNLDGLVEPTKAAVWLLDTLRQEIHQAVDAIS